MHSEPTASPQFKSGDTPGHRHPASALGAGVLSLLQPEPGETILDVGCGNGNLTAKIAASGARPIGIDLSEEMVERARAKYPDLHFQTEDARRYRSDVQYDAVFSHASLHWIQDAPEVARSIWLSLKEGGRFVAEFAGSGNVAALTSAMREALEAHGYDWAGRNPWYHPTIGEYASLLERTGFHVTLAQHFDSPSPLHGESGIRLWLENFASFFFHDVPSDVKASMFGFIEAKVKPQLYQEGQWMLDTRRLRIAAVKNNGKELNP